MPRSFLLSDKTNRYFVVAGVALLTSCGDPAKAQSFQPLGFLPTGEDQSTAFGVSASGEFVIGASDVKDGYEAFRWDGIMSSLGDLPGDDLYGVARAVSADGSVVVGAGNYGTNREAFRWYDGSMSGLGDLPGGKFSSEATAVSADGSVIVGLGSSANGLEAFRWTDGAMTGLGRLPNTDYSRAYGVSADGTVVVGGSASYNQGNDRNEAFRWEGGVMSGIGFLPGGDSSGASAISADGKVVGGRASGTAFRWKDGVMHGLGDIAGGGITRDAVALSADGSTIVGWGEGEEGTDAFVWDETHGARSIRAILVDAGLNLAGWELLQARGVSADGNVIVGYGRNPCGHFEAWIVRMNDDPNGPCYANCEDCPATGNLDLFDFLCYQNRFNDGDAYADCTGDGVLDLFDFLCFVNAFNAGC